RAQKPKPFLQLVTGNTLLAETYARVGPLAPPARTWVVCGRAHVDGVREALPDLPGAHLIVEPAARNTAPAIGLSAVHALRADRDAVLLVLPSDHHVAHPERFREALEKAARIAQQGDLVTLGIRPTRPETGYGYLRRGVEREPGVFAVEAFVEKPDARTAERYLADGRHSWNAGIFVLRADALIEALRRHLPAVHEGLQQIAADMGRADEVFPRLPSISIDYGVMEPESKAEFAEALGRGFGSYLLEKSPGAQSVVLGRDHRMSSPALARGFSRGVRATGVDVCSIGIVPTPLTYFAANTLPVDGLCMITGSHNPPDYNGFKVGIGKSTLAGSEIQELKERVLHPKARGAARDGIEWEFDVVTPYLHFVTQSLGKAARKL